MTGSETEETRTVRDWFFEDRVRTIKRFTDLNWTEEVRIREKATSPRRIVKLWAGGLVAWALILAYLAVMVLPPREGLIEQTISLLGGGVAAIFVLIAAFATFKGVKIWWQRVFGEPFCCEECGGPSNYPHEFSWHWDTGKTNSYYFCSPDCRRRWEVENVEYPFSGYYDIQCEDDEDPVKLQHYSSAYEVEGEANV